MKNFIKLIASAIVATIGVRIGGWLWDKKLQGKVEDFDDYLKSKKS